MERYSRRDEGGEEGRGLAKVEEAAGVLRAGEKVKASGCKRCLGLVVRKAAVETYRGENQIYFNGRR